MARNPVVTFGPTVIPPRTPHCDVAYAGAETPIAASGALHAIPRATVRRVTVLLALLVLRSDADMPLPSPIGYPLSREASPEAPRLQIRET
jgi:hypothetical protein